MLGEMYSCYLNYQYAWWDVLVSWIYWKFSVMILAGPIGRGAATSGCASTLSVHSSNLRLRKYNLVCNLRLYKKLSQLIVITSG